MSHLTHKLTPWLSDLIMSTLFVNIFLSDSLGVEVRICLLFIIFSQLLDLFVPSDAHFSYFSTLKFDTMSVLDLFTNFWIQISLFIRMDSIVVSYYDAVLRQSDVALLSAPNWLNDQIVSFFFEYLRNDHFKYSKDYQKLAFIDPAVTQMIKLCSEPYETQGQFCLVCC